MAVSVIARSGLCSCCNSLLWMLIACMDCGIGCDLSDEPMSGSCWPEPMHSMFSGGKRFCSRPHALCMWLVRKPQSAKVLVVS